MAEIHPVRSLLELEGEVKRREITFTNHFIRDSLPDRPNLTKEEVRETVETPWNEKALAFDYKGEKKFGHRYNIVFHKSTQYYLLTGVDINDKKVEIVTAFQTNRNYAKPKELAKQYG
ncbi:MAG: hypothetical protein H8Z69_02050 [Nanohaloarchaea archaeon]|nr:hypothetical protein [Candidatus Nanohaloarchaea archaeon]